MIIIDASAAVHNKAGLSRYGQELIAAAVADPAHRSEYGVFYHDATTAQPNAVIRSLPAITTDQAPKPWRLRALLAQLVNMSQDYLLAGSPEVVGAPAIFHATEHLLPRFKRSKTVFTLHDLIFKFFPQHHLPLNRAYLSLAFPLFLRRADVIICVSEQSKRDAQNVYRIPDEKLRVIYEGVDPRFQRVTDRLTLARVHEHYHLPERFILSVGTIEPRKNLKTVFEAFAEWRKSGEARQGPEDVRLVVVGRQGWLVEETMRAVQELGLTEQVLFTGFVADEDLPAVYSMAEAMVFPSVYEGFGLPPLEALACGTPVACSDASSLPEVMGDAGLLIPPTDVRAWMLGLGRLLMDADLRRDLSARGPRQAALFTWADAARKTRIVYEELLVKRKT